MEKHFKKTALGGLIDNPVFVLVLGMCPLIATSNTINSAFWLGLATLGVLICSNTIISLLRRVIPEKIRIPCYIMIIATFGTLADMLLRRFLDAEFYATIGAAISLIVVNCIVLARAESYAAKNKPHYALLDGVSMGLGFLVAIMLLAGFRVFLSDVCGIMIFSQTAGGFLALAILMAIFNYVFHIIKGRQKVRESEQEIESEHIVEEGV